MPPFEKQTKTKPSKDIKCRTCVCGEKSCKHFNKLFKVTGRKKPFLGARNWILCEIISKNPELGNNAGNEFDIAFTKQVSTLKKFSQNEISCMSQPEYNEVICENLYDPLGLELQNWKRKKVSDEMVESENEDDDEKEDNQSSDEEDNIQDGGQLFLSIINQDSTNVNEQQLDTPTTPLVGEIATNSSSTFMAEVNTTEVETPFENEDIDLNDPDECPIYNTKRACYVYFEEEVLGNVIELSENSLINYTNLKEYLKVKLNKNITDITYMENSFPCELSLSKCS
ncbi:predicted protein [Naegleria gruberi]|uniref:Predicted protein n=1 Tax=Naegleria gruberi TaxID=5762 RepID=D2W0V4_NAEGR|nr:uncharacterized protein NAEGRDRAFT_53820 [Naegleria gruberi]EFC37208.1 predicted protein [Naegleria gruberi]|eukprot:XP_002669952.1 predicted protein [Naegleria gruberi strain NEG-M]